MLIKILEIILGSIVHISYYSSTSDNILVSSVSKDHGSFLEKQGKNYQQIRGVCCKLLETFH